MTSCSARSAALGEPLPGTAPQARVWLVVEQSGGFAGRDALTTSGFPADIGRRIAARLPDGAKVVLARRPGRHPREVHPARNVWVARTQFGDTHAWHTRIGGPADLLDWGLESLGDRTPPGATPMAAPMLLLCSHARRDRCCAVGARRLVSTLSDTAGIWEASHLGGHRFAPVALEVTTGYVYGRVTAEDVDAIRALPPGDVHVPAARGHSGLTPRCQAADLWLRAANALPHSLVESGEDVYAMTDAGARVLRVRRRPLGDRPESCGATPEPAFAWTVDTSATDRKRR